MTKPFYRISVISRFSGAHSLKGYPGSCGRLHGHNWRVRVVVKSEGLDSIGMSFDFTVLSSHVKDVVGRLDHTDLSTHAEFRDRNPTAENIAAFIYREVKRDLPPGVSMDAVEISETDDFSVSYSE